AERRDRVAGGGVAGVGAEREHVRDRLPQHGETALAAAVAERDPAIRQDVRVSGARPGRGALRRRGGCRDRARGPGGAGRGAAAAIAAWAPVIMVSHCCQAVTTRARCALMSVLSLGGRASTAAWRLRVSVSCALAAVSSDDVVANSACAV